MVKLKLSLLKFKGQNPREFSPVGKDIAYYMQGLEFEPEPNGP